jgi:hypothetical protein
MKLNIKMPNRLIPFYKKELEAFKDNLLQDNLQNAWFHLEIISRWCKIIF